MIWDLADENPDYIPPSHQHIFGSLSDPLHDLETPSNFTSRVQTPLPGGGIATPPPDGAPSPTHTATVTETIGDALRKALAPNRRDGPGLVRAMERFNNAMEEIQNDGTLIRWMDGRPGLSQREWSGLVDCVHDQAYSKVVGPYSNELEVGLFRLRIALALKEKASSETSRRGCESH